MPTNPRIEQLRAIQALPELWDYLRDVLNWPIEDYGVEELTFDWKVNKLNLSRRINPRRLATKNTISHQKGMC